MIRAKGTHGTTLLDVGGGVGVIQHELVGAGVERVTDVDASSAYLAAARTEAGRRGYAERASYVHGDFVDVAAGVPTADIVTLDRVVCCYPDFHALVSSSSGKARRMYGLVYPGDAWAARVGMGAANLLLRLRRSPFRVFVHNPEQVEALLAASGWSKGSQRDLLVWRVVLFERPASTGDTPVPSASRGA